MTGGLFEEYTKQTIDNNNLEKVLYKLVELENGEKLLDLLLLRLEQRFESNISIRDENRDFKNLTNETERNKVAHYSNELFQGLNVVNFLNQNVHKLSEQSFFMCLRFITFAQLADGEFDILNRLMKNLLEVVINNKNTRTVKFLVNAASSQYLKIKHLQEHLSELSPDQKEDVLQTLAELRNNQENNSDIDLAIKNLSFIEES